MPSNSNESETVAVPSAVQTAARRYWRRTLALRGLLGVGYFGVSVAILLTLPYVPALAVIAVLLGTFAVPVFKNRGTIELTTHRSPDVVADDFTRVPPVLGFQAALADNIRLTDVGTEYELSSALGLRSTTMRVETERVADRGEPETDVAINVVVTVGDEPWGQYQITANERDGDTAVTIRMVPDRRFGVRRLPDFVFGRRYRSHLFAGQGYTLVADDTSLSV